MTRILTVAAAQLGPIQRDESRASAVARMIELMRQAKGHGADLVVYPEAALTAFFPHWWIEDEDEIDGYFESAMPSNETAPLFAEAQRLGIGFHLGYCELAFEEGRKCRFNTAILVDKTGAIVGKYRKIHLPGHPEHRPDAPFQNLEKRYFETGNLGWPVWRTMDANIGMMICNDRRWPESYRVDGPAGCRADRARLQHAQAQPAGARP
jgi:predicted amidohydrolase